jgi:ParE toxin of type II toxin-antitoxin system, parDE
MNYTFHPHAEKELKEIEDHYNNLTDGLGDRFLGEIEVTISSIQKFPDGWPLLSAPIRHCRLNKFPYELIYYVKSGQVHILAVTCIIAADLVIGHTALEHKSKTRCPNFLSGAESESSGGVSAEGALG